ncbi:hypothetical protein [Haloplanus natans]|uniref:hypothetical protein n=1 Tax=Haloplanus natans TaxID=376171 RepID=UPI0006781B57|nr:hypothetical protein [Haloplanus natans]
MGDDRVERRTILGAGAGLLASLSGCSGLFIEPEATGTPGGDAPTATTTATPTATATPEPTPEPTPTPAPLPSEDIEIRNRRLAVRRSQFEKFAFVTYRFDIENVGTRTIRDAEFRVRVRYEHEEFSRLAATDYPRFRFDDDADDDEDGLTPDETAGVSGRVRFERDGRAQESTAGERFDLELAVRRIRYVR